MNIFKLISDLISQLATSSFYISIVILFLFFFAISLYCIKKMLKTADGRLEIWYALSSNLIHRIVFSFGKRILRKISEVQDLSCIVRSTKLRRMRIPSDALSSTLMGLCLLSIVILPIGSSMIYGKAVIGTIHLYDNVINILNSDTILPFHLPNVVILAILSALSVTQLLITKNNRFIQLLGTIFVAAIFYDSWYFGGSTSIYPIFSVMALYFLILVGDGRQAILAIIVFALLYSFFFCELFGCPGVHAIFLPTRMTDLPIIATCFLIVRYLVYRRNSSGLSHDEYIFGPLTLFIAGYAMAMIAGVQMDVMRALMLISGITIALTLSELMLKTMNSASISFIVFNVLMVVIVLLIGYWLGVSSWPIVIVITCFVVLLSAVSISMLISSIISVNLAALGLRRNGLPYVAADLMFAILFYGICVLAFLLFVSYGEARPGVAYFRISDVSSAFKNNNSETAWLFFLFVVTLLPVFVHVTNSALVITSQLPDFIRKHLTNLLDRLENKEIGLEKDVLSTVIGAWVAMWFTVVAIFFYAAFLLGGQFVVSIAEVLLGIMVAAT